MCIFGVKFWVVLFVVRTCVSSHLTLLHGFIAAYLLGHVNASFRLPLLNRCGQIMLLLVCSYDEDFRVKPYWLFKNFDF